jgi:integrase
MWFQTPDTSDVTLEEPLMPTIKLTKRAIDAARPSEQEFHLWDEEITGFGVRVQPSGRKTFVFKCRPGGGRDATQRKLTIGEYGSVTPIQARKEAQRLAGDVAAGRDPGEVRNQRRNASRAAREAPTVAELGTDFLDDANARRKPGTAREYRRMWNGHVVPALGGLRVADVTTAHVGRLHRSMSATPYMANRVLALVSSFLNFAERQGARARHSNPARDVEPYPEVARERFLSPPELARLAAALMRAGQVGLPTAPNRRRNAATERTKKHIPKSAAAPVPANAYAVAAISFLMLTGWREREALSLKWSDVDILNRRAILPDTKTGRSVRPLGAAACRLLESLPRVAGSPYVFPGKSPDKPLIEINRVWYAVRHQADLNDVRLHDLRHTFASMMASGGSSLLMIGKALGHKELATTARYAHLLEDPVHAAVSSAAEGIAAHLSAPSPLTSMPGAAGGR